jgi:uncharacterized membrane protein YtjA (UPF0391 family)
MLGYGILFLLLAVLCGVLGFGGFVVGTLSMLGKVFLLLFIILFVVSLVRGSSPVDPTL